MQLTVFFPNKSSALSVFIKGCANKKIKCYILVLKSITKMCTLLSLRGY